MQNLDELGRWVSLDTSQRQPADFLEVEMHNVSTGALVL